MSETNPTILELEARLDSLVRTQIDFQVEITAIRRELSKLRRAENAEHKDEAKEIPFVPTRPPSPTQRPIADEHHKPPPAFQASRESTPPPSFGYGSAGSEPRVSRAEEKVSEFFAKYTESAREDLEKFIGENLISKIGILILIIGLGIGVKYSIDNDLISPLTRIVIGYIFGFGLAAFAIKLKAKYHNFSAVLMSGGMATMYFVTFFAHSLYALLPQMTAFGLMAMFTVLTVSAALVYSRQVIAHIGLVGAYAVPFLLSNNSGNYLFLFVYMTIINAGILAISVKRDWKSLFYSSFTFTWLIFAGWFFDRYSVEHFGLAVVFLAVFFAIFFATNLVHLGLRQKSDDIESLIGSAVTCLVFYGFCIAIGNSPLSDSQTTIFFAYLAVIATVIVLISFRYFGKLLVYLSGPAVWLTYATWFANRYEPESQFVIAATFAVIFFTVFYVTTIACRLAREGFSALEYAGAILTNSFVFFGFGYSMVDGREQLQNYLGLYTAAHSALHLLIAAAVNRIRPSAVDVIQVLTILILTFASIAIPVQFDGNFVTMIWAAEAAFLFWMGRARGVRLFEYFSYPVMVLGFVSMLGDWMAAMGAGRQPLANGDIVTALVVVGSFAFIFLVNRVESFEAAMPSELIKPFGYAAAGIAIFVLYNAFRIEIGNFYEVRAAAIDLTSLDSFRLLGDIRGLNVIWQVNYTLLFLGAMGLINQLKVRSRSLAVIDSALAVLTLFIFATVVMLLFSELRESLQRSESALIDRTNLAIRYISYVFAGGMLYVLYRYVRDELLLEWLNKNVILLIFEAVFYPFVFIVCNCELVNLMGQYYLADATKLGLTIFWGVYALAMVVLGIAWDKKHLRVGAIVLLAFTLAKLFFYDIADLGTIAKTVLFVTLGITLLVISFLYNKYKTVIFPAAIEPEPEPIEGSVTEP